MESDLIHAFYPPDEEEEENTEDQDERGNLRGLIDDGDDEEEEEAGSKSGAGSDSDEEVKHRRKKRSKSDLLSQPFHYLSKIHHIKMACLYVCNIPNHLLTKFCCWLNNWHNLFIVAS